MSFIKLIQADVIDVLSIIEPVHLVFADGPDNIGLKYNEYEDNLSSKEYISWLDKILRLCVRKSNVVWFSHNSKWAFEIGRLVCGILEWQPLWEAKACVQTFSFGQHNQNDLGNNHRPLLRLMKRGTKLYPDAIRVPSWRQEHNDSRADPRGRVPGDVFDVPRITGNSKQRRAWHPTQLKEELVERCLKLCCGPDDVILDAFSGTGTTLRICKRLELPVISVEVDKFYCEKIAEENGLEKIENSSPWEAAYYGW